MAENLASHRDTEQGQLELRHLRFGWWTVFVFVLLGIALEGLHAFKSEFFLSANHETRRLMWTLSHAHGTLLGLVNIAMAFTLTRVSPWPPRSRRLASGSLLAATLLIPGGFFLGGLVIHAGDPGPGVFLVPPGGLLLLYAVFLLARATRVADPR